MSQTSSLDYYMSWRMPVCGLPYKWHVRPSVEIRALLRSFMHFLCILRWVQTNDTSTASFQALFFNSFSGGWSPTGLESNTAATDWPMVACTGWLWWWRIWWNEDWQGEPKYSEITCHSATLSTTNPTWPDPGPYPGRRGGKPVTNRLSYGVAFQALSHPPLKLIF
jgi:hypothetical protein